MVVIASINARSSFLLPSRRLNFFLSALRRVFAVRLKQQQQQGVDTSIEAVSYSYPEVRVPMDALVEVMADPVMLLVSENRSASFSSAANVPSTKRK